MADYFAAKDMNKRVMPYYGNDNRWENRTFYRPVNWIVKAPRPCGQTE